jgi:hypothetical protein
LTVVACISREGQQHKSLRDEVRKNRGSEGGGGGLCLREGQGVLLVAVCDGGEGGAENGREVGCAGWMRELKCCCANLAVARAPVMIWPYTWARMPLAAVGCKTAVNGGSDDVKRMGYLRVQLCGDVLDGGKLGLACVKKRKASEREVKERRWREGGEREAPSEVKRNSWKPWAPV